MNSPRQHSSEALALEVASLKKLVVDLSKYKRAMEAQKELFRSILMMSNVASGKLMLRSILLEISEVTRDLLKAQDASLFILNPKGVIIESILARGPTIQEEKTHLIGTILDRGLAGWVYRYRRMALVKDTQQDERWLNFENQPYEVGSALCVPFLRGSLVLGILTLTHPKPRHFNEDMEDFMSMFSPSIAIALDHARIYLESH
ncbi:GAF domain-containing protein [Cyanobacterium aponinum]|uniref:GAF domain-containing protein n=1 Tax=Cyanobacterium aponinum 0216 TaxID=2676140 RepID=A0A844GNK6_9CHRO|nr:GAF domain-containing protein [Cyanobacterium aponinum]MTF38184.1 GAF domain-containing protein [Cyanobacterium aponinum 0216]